jgi:hypothetical protein
LERKAIESAVLVKERERERNMVEVDSNENIKDSSELQKDTLDIPKSVNEKSDSEISDDDDGG